MPSRGFEKFDSVKQQKYLGILRSGVRRNAAARAVGVHPETVGNYRKRHSGFSGEESLAEIEAIELVEASLFKAAVAGSVHAARAWLRNRDPDNWDDRRLVRMHVEMPQRESIRPMTSPFVKAVLDSPRATTLALQLLDVIGESDAEPGEGHARGTRQG